ncbi:hypothetical protein V7068_11580 [Bacillus sp. JJ634]
MNKWFISLAFFCAFTIGLSFQVQALTFEQLPTKQTSKQWSVQVGEVKQGEETVKPVKGKFHTYSLKIDKIGKDVLSAEVYMYRNEPGSKTKYALVGCPDEKECNKGHFEQSISLAKQLNDGIPYRFTNFALAEKATELEIEVIWTQKGSEGRPLKETFVFTQQ